ncbi:MAG: hypothetical protein HEQ39_06590 [Rhizobacter sp.]
MNTGMRGIFKTLIFLSYAFGMVVIYAFSGRKYDWMKDENPLAVIPRQLEEGFSNRQIFTFSVLLFLVSLQVILFLSSANSFEKYSSVVFSAMAISLWYFLCYKT